MKCRSIKRKSIAYAFTKLEKDGLKMKYFVIEYFYHDVRVLSGHKTLKAANAAVKKLAHWEGRVIFIRELAFWRNPNTKSLTDYPCKPYGTEV